MTLFVTWKSHVPFLRYSVPSISKIVMPRRVLPNKVEYIFECIYFESFYLPIKTSQLVDIVRAIF